jgi:hypothetical protein
MSKTFANVNILVDICERALNPPHSYCRTKQCYPGVIGWAQAER